MNYATRSLLLGAAFEAFLLPIATAHTLVSHPEWLSSFTIRAAVVHPDAVLMVILTLFATIPSFQLCRAAWEWRRASMRFAVIAASGTPQTLRGLRYVRIPGEQVALFTTGARQSTIYATAGAEQALGSEPFFAALLHEQAHARRRDVLWLALAAAVGKAFEFLPACRETLCAIQLQIERGADAEALSAGAAPADLFEAIVAASSPQAVAALSAAGVEQRLRWLADEEEEPSFPQRGALALLGASALLPTLAHALLWTEIICAVCSSHIVG